MNYIFIVIGVGIIIGEMIRNKTNFYNKKYFSKLELKYGSIDRERTIKLDKIYSYLLGLLYIMIGLLIREKTTSITVVVAISVVMLVGYYSIRKKYIAI